MTKSDAIRILKQVIENRKKQARQGDTFAAATVERLREQLQHLIRLSGNDALDFAENIGLGDGGSLCY